MSFLDRISNRLTGGSSSDEDGGSSNSGTTRRQRDLLRGSGDTLDDNETAESAVEESSSSSSSSGSSGRSRSRSSSSSSRPTQRERDLTRGSGDTLDDDETAESSVEESSSSSSSSGSSGPTQRERDLTRGSGDTIEEDLPDIEEDVSTDSPSSSERGGDLRRPIAAGSVGIAAATQGSQALDRFGEFVTETRSRGTSEDPLSTAVEDDIRQFFGDPGAGVREFGSGLTARIDDFRPEIDLEDELNQLERFFDPRQELTPDDELQQILDDFDEATADVDGAPPPGFGVFGPAGPIRAGFQAARGAPEVASTTARSGPTGSQLAEGVGRQGRFAVEGVDSLIRATGVGAGVGAFTQAEIEAPAESPTTQQTEIEAPTTNRPINQPEIESPESTGSGSTSVDQPEIETPSTNRPIDQPEIETPESTGTGSTSVDLPTIETAELITRQEELNEEDELEDSAIGRNRNVDISREEIVIPEEFIPDDTITIGELPDNSINVDVGDLDDSVTVDIERTQERGGLRTFDEAEVQQQSVESGTDSIGSTDFEPVEVGPQPSEAFGGFGVFEDLDSDLVAEGTTADPLDEDVDVGAGVGTRTGSAGGLGLGSFESTSVDVDLGLDQPVDSDTNVDVGTDVEQAAGTRSRTGLDVDLGLDQPVDNRQGTQTTTRTETQSQTDFEAPVVESPGLQERTFTTPATATRTSLDPRVLPATGSGSSGFDIDVSPLEFEDDEVEFDTRFFDEIDEEIGDIDFDLDDF